MQKRRTFIKRLGALTAGASFSGLALNAKAGEVSDALQALNTMSPEEAVQDEEIWRRVQMAYSVDPNLINLNNGGVSPQPIVVQEALERYNSAVNLSPSLFMWRHLAKGGKAVRLRLADLAGCEADEIAIVRNTTEALNNVIFGIDLKKGDEVVLSKTDYPNVINAWKMREARDGIVLKWVEMKLPVDDEDKIIAKYNEQYTSRTRVVSLTHMLNWTGQIMPIKRLCAEARSRGILSMVDGAHSFAHFEFRIDDLGCDFFGTSLHKWLCAPLGTGMLWMRKEHVANTWPLFPPPNPKTDVMSKFETFGTHSIPSDLAIRHAIEFHHSVGSQRKEARLRYLKDYWMDKLKDLPRFTFYTPRDPRYSCGMGSVNIGSDLDRSLIERQLLSKYGINVGVNYWEGMDGMRIAPHIYVTTEDLDRFIEGLHVLIDKFKK